MSLAIINLIQCSSFYTLNGLALSQTPGDTAPAHALPAMTELLSEQGEGGASPALGFPIKSYFVLQICLNEEEQMITQAYEDSG